MFISYNLNFIKHFAAFFAASEAFFKKFKLEKYARAYWP
jgi:hypothetical protein